MEKHPLEGIMGESMQHIKKLVDVNTIIGEPITLGDGTTIIPVSKVSFGFASGGSDFAPKADTKGTNNLFGGGSGGGVTINPVAFLTVNGDLIKLLPVSGTNTTADKIIDLVPELVTKFNKIVNEIVDKRAQKKEAELSKETEIEL